MYFLKCPITVIFFLPFWPSLTLLIFVFSSFDAMCHVPGLFSWPFLITFLPQVEWTGHCEALLFWNKTYLQSVNIVSKTYKLCQPHGYFCKEGVESYTSRFQTLIYTLVILIFVLLWKSGSLNIYIYYNYSHFLNIL